MKKILIFSAVLSFIVFPVSSCSNKKNHTEGKKALFETKLEAEKAAKDFNCHGAHKMGNKWMPCQKHGMHHNH
tara:strand:+ start:502 stop:720 length:219 start_codon:yes stop_codon:yes gene_type:complete